MNLKKTIQDNRKRLRLSRKEASEKLGVSQATYTHWELGKSTPKPKDLVNLKDLFKITLNELMGVSNWNSVKTPPKDWGYYLVKQKNSRVVKIAVYDESQFLCEPIDQWALIPKI